LPILIRAREQIVYTKTTTIEGGAVVIPAELRERYGLEDGSVLVIEADEGGILLRPEGEPGIERYTLERKAEFLLNNAIDADDYAWAVEEVRRMGVDPESVPHRPVR
jgi:AbrB family looped-hinge helix DNA binding protein